MSNVQLMLSSALTFREMLSIARNPIEYRLRTLVGLVASGLMGFALLRTGGDPSTGLSIYTALHATIIVLLLVVTPTLTADLISRERREGTLDLLFLTPLTGTQIVSSKLFSQTLRTFVIWLSTCPIAIVPLLSGGISPELIGITLCAQFSCLVIGLVTGITISCFSASALNAIILSIITTVAVVAIDYGVVFAPLFGPFSDELLVWATQCLAALIGLPMMLTQRGLVLPGRSISTLQTFLSNTFWITAGSFALMLFLGRCLGAQSHRGAPSALRKQLHRLFLTPALLKDWLQASKRRKLNSNPFLWLEYRSAWSRSLRSILVGVLILAETYLLMSSMLLQQQVIIGLVLLLVLAVTSAAAFKREKENGAFELLLISPLSEYDLITGRLRAVWSYYTPAAVVFVIMLVLSLQLDWTHALERNPQIRPHLLSVFLSAFTVPLAGLYFALTCRNFVQILLGTALCGIFVPFFVSDLLRVGLVEPHEPSIWGAISTTVLHFYLIKGFAKGTLNVLRTRRFSL